MVLQKYAFSYIPHITILYGTKAKSRLYANNNTLNSSQSNSNTSDSTTSTSSCANGNHSMPTGA